MVVLYVYYYVMLHCMVVEYISFNCIRFVCLIYIAWLYELT